MGTREQCCVRGITVLHGEHELGFGRRMLPAPSACWSDDAQPRSACWLPGGQLLRRGDPSDDFKFATFFPQPAQPAVERVSGAVTRVARLASIKGGGPRLPRGLAGAVAGAAGAALPAEAVEAARRRERGARALEERLGVLNKAGDGEAAGPADIEAPAGPSVEEAAPAPAAAAAALAATPAAAAAGASEASAAGQA